MKLRESIDIAAEPIAVWPLVSDPVRMAEWNPKIVAVDRASNQPVRVGERYSMIYTMSGREQTSDVEVVAAQPPVTVTFRNYATPATRPGFVDESYDLTFRGSSTRVVQTIDLRRSGIPWLFRVLMWLIHRYGWSNEASYLERLKRAVENGPEEPPLSETAD